VRSGPPSVSTSMASALTTSPSRSRPRAASTSRRHGCCVRKAIAPPSLTGPRCSSFLSPVTCDLSPAVPPPPQHHPNPADGAGQEGDGGGLRHGLGGGRKGVRLALRVEAVPDDLAVIVDRASAY
jgi:hypothetical protein